MHTFQMNSHVSENGVLSVTLPKEWAKQRVNVLLVLEPLTQPVLTESQQRKKNLKEALSKAAALNVFEGIDGVEWQKEQRQDRMIGREEEC
ncbi:MAG: hypothetical protein WBI40_08880 [Methylococcaceae bacterium]